MTWGSHVRQRESSSAPLPSRGRARLPERVLAVQPSSGSSALPSGSSPRWPCAVRLLPRWPFRPPSMPPTAGRPAPSDGRPPATSCRRGCRSAPAFRRRYAPLPPAAVRPPPTAKYASASYRCVVRSRSGSAPRCSCRDRRSAGPSIPCRTGYGRGQPASPLLPCARWPDRSPPACRHLTKWPPRLPAQQLERWRRYTLQPTACA